MSLFAELKRRNVIRVAVAYIVATWLLVQVLELAADVFAAPDWVMKLIITGMVVGIVPVLIVSWVYQLTPEGAKRESDIPREESITAHTAKKLDIAVIVLLFAVMGMMGYNQLSGSLQCPDPGIGCALAPPGAYQLSSEGLVRRA